MVSGMSKVYTDADLKRIFGTYRKDSVVIDQKMQEAYAEIRQKGKQDKIIKINGKDDQSTRHKINRHIGAGRIWKKAAGGLGVTAATFLLTIIFCATNPALAAGLPVIGSIFAKVQEIFPFGKIPEEDVTYLQGDGKDNDAVNGESVKGSDAEAEEDLLPQYQASDQGITFTLTEYYASNQAIFIGVRVENEEPFPELVSSGEPDGYQLLQLMTTETYSFRDIGDEVVIGGRDLEGKLEDEYTFVGIMRIDYDSIRVDDRKYIAAYKEAEANGEPLPEVDAETYDFYMDEYTIPDSFQMQLQIDRFRGYPESEGQGGLDDYRINGIWTIPDTLDISPSKQGSTTIWINEMNEEGIGMEYIEISPIELTLHPYKDTDRLCIAVAFDKDSRWIENGSTNFYELATQDHDTSVITVYICDYDEYMDELKGIRIQQGDAAFQKVLEERALYKKVIEVEN